MNRYFLFIACLQLWPVVAPVNPITIWLPLLLAVFVTALKAAYDDVKRYKSDREFNMKKFQVWNSSTNNWVWKYSKDICCGDVVKIVEHQEFPCDLVLLQSSLPHGQAYMQTANLDGELDLKQRYAPKLLADALSSQQFSLSQLQGRVECPNPNPKIYSFDAKMKIDSFSTEEYSLFADQLLLQCCHLKNTAWVIAMAVYTGNETKCGENKGYPKMKRSRADRTIDKMAFLIFCFQLTIMVVFGTVATIFKYTWQRNLDTFWYLQFPTTSPWYDWLILPIRFLLLTSYMVPISLKIQTDMVKLCYAYFISSDLQMYHNESDTPATVRNSNISEDLGQVEYILSDKTGTLTCNEMQFEQCSISGVMYSNLEKMQQALYQQSTEMMILFWKALALCHTCQRLPNQHYSSSSPDEVCLVSAAKQLKMELIQTENDQYTLFNGITQLEEQYQVCNILKFTSQRKRMSVIVRHVATQQLYLFCKGADDVLIPKLAKHNDNKTTMDHLSWFAKQGLRTLVICYKPLSEEEYQKWSKEFHTASVSMSHRETQLQYVFDLIERELQLLGATAIKDILQEDLPQTITLLRKASIKMWVLTGDKKETAQQIAISCGLILNHPEREPLICIHGNSKEDVYHQIHQPNLPSHYALLIDGHTFDFILNDLPLQLLFRSVACRANAVICCRVTPSQKASIVKLVKSLKRIVLAIGDGGNDVPMVMEADIGVGIQGKEGMEAARASDFSFCQFKSLIPLLFVHGQYSHHRTSILAQFAFYKNIFLALMQVTYNVMTGMSGISPYNDLSLSFYNIIWSTLYNLNVILDRPISQQELVTRPKLYRYSKKSQGLHLGTFAFWFASAVLHAILCLAIQIIALYYSDPNMDNINTRDVFGNLLYTSALWMDILMFCLCSRSFSILSIVLLFTTICGYYLFMVVYSYALPLQWIVFPKWFRIPGIYEIYGVFAKHILLNSYSYLIILLQVMVCMVPVVTLLTVKNMIQPSILQRYLQFRNEFGKESEIVKQLGGSVEDVVGWEQEAITPMEEEEANETFYDEELELLRLKNKNMAYNSLSNTGSEDGEEQDPLLHKDKSV